MRIFHIVILMALASCSSYTYKDEWHVIYPQNNGEMKEELVSNSKLYKVPGSTCILSPAASKEDGSSRMIACAKEQFQENMDCFYSVHFVDDSNAECYKKVGDVHFVGTVTRESKDRKQPEYEALAPKKYIEYDEYTYENSWKVISAQNESNIAFSTQSEHLTKVGDMECALGPVSHLRTKEEDKFSRDVYCFGEKEFQEKFECAYDPNYRDEDKESDTYRTRCSKKINDIIVSMTLVRYPKGKYWNKVQQKREVENNVPY